MAATLRVVLFFRLPSTRVGRNGRESIFCLQWFIQSRNKAVFIAIGDFNGDGIPDPRSLRGRSSR